MKRLAYWRETVEAGRDTRGPVDLPAAADVAIVGAGLTGLSAALTLTKLGARVTVLETHEVGWGASSRNGGMVLSGLKLSPHELIARYGLDAARRLDASSIEAIDFVERLVGEERIACDFARCGHLALASKRSHFAQFEREAALLAQAFGRHVRLVPPADLHDEVGSSAYHGGMVDDASASVNPAKLVYGLAQAARRSGAAVLENTPVTRIARRNTGAAGFTVATGRGDLAANEVIVATGAYTGAESPWLTRRIVPIGSYVIATEPLGTTRARELSPRNRMMYDSKRFLHYFRLTPDDRVLFGGRASFVPESERALSESVDILRKDMVAVFPQLRDAAVEYAWGGTIDFTLDMLPHAGVLDGIHYAVGYAGHGVALATHLGARLAASISGGDGAGRAGAAADPLMRPLPVSPAGLRMSSSWLVPAAGAWYRFLDAMS